MTLLRPATPDDADAMAALHVAVWRETYDGLAPPEALARLDLAHRRRGWAAALADPARRVWLAEGGAGALGLVAVGRPEVPEYAALGTAAGEVKHLYVAAAARRTGLGRALLQQALAGLAAQGCTAAGLGVVRQNYAARAFYAAAGGREVADFTDPGPLWRSAMVLVGWDLSAPRPR